MNPKDEMLLETWPKKQAKGKLLYMVSYALLYALIVGVISLLFRNDEEPVKEVILSKEYLIKLTLFMAIGLTIAHFRWKANNKKYEALKQQSNQEL